MTLTDWRGVSVLVGGTVVATHGRSTAPFEAEVLSVADDRVSVRVVRHPKALDCDLDVVDVDPSRLVVVDWLPPSSVQRVGTARAEFDALVAALVEVAMTHDFPDPTSPGWSELPCRRCGLLRRDLTKETLCRS